MCSSLQVLGDGNPLAGWHSFRAANANKLHVYIQEIWGFISPGIVAALLVGLIVKQAPPLAAKAAMWLGIPLYAACRVPKWVLDSVFGGEPPAGFWRTVYQFSSWSFLHHMGLVFVALALTMLVVTRFRPLTGPRAMPVSRLDVEPHRHQHALGAGVIAITAALYVAFW